MAQVRRAQFYTHSFNRASGVPAHVQVPNAIAAQRPPPRTAQRPPPRQQPRTLPPGAANGQLFGPARAPDPRHSRSASLFASRFNSTFGQKQSQLQSKSQRAPPQAPRIRPQVSQPNFNTRAARPTQPGPSRPTEIVNAEFTTLDVLVGNSVLAVQQKRGEAVPRTNFLTINGRMQTDENAQLDQDYTQGRTSFEFPSSDLRLGGRRIKLVELVLEISGELGDFTTYLGRRAQGEVEATAGIHLLVGDAPITYPLPIRTIGDYLQYAELQSYDFAPLDDAAADPVSSVLHHFRIPLGRDNDLVLDVDLGERLRVEVSGFDFSQLGRRHRFFVKWHEA